MPRAQKLPSGSWRVRVYDGKDQAGKDRYKSFTAGTKKQAEFLAAEYAAKKKNFVESITVGEAIDRYIASKSNVLSPTTIYGYEKIRKNNLQGLMAIKIDRLTREQVQSAVNTEAATHSAKTVINAHGLLSAALAMHNPDFILRTTLPRKIKKLKRDLPTSEDVMKAIHGSPVELPILLAMCQCLRISEVRGIRKSALQGNFLSIERVIVTVKGQHIEKELLKTDASCRIEEIPDFLRDMILASESEYITNLSARAIYGRFVNLMKKAGFTGIRFHDLRHISATDMHSQGIPDKVAADRGGWAGTQTMRQVYQHSFTDDRKEADRKMNRRYSELYSHISEENEKHDTKYDTTIENNVES